MLYYLGTLAHTAKYQNPHTRGEVVAAMSSRSSNAGHGPVYGRAEVFVQHKETTSDLIFTSGDAPNQWLSVDLGEGRGLVPTHYCLRHSSQPRYVLRNWTLEASADGITWAELRVHDNDSSLARGIYSVASWPIVNCDGCYQHFRIRQFGENSDSTSDQRNYLLSAGIELYGGFSDRNYVRIPPCAP